MSSREYDPDKPWDRQPFDTDLSWSILSEYLGLPAPRSLRKLLRPGYPVNWAQLETMANEGFWDARAQLWDEHLDSIRTETIERVTEETAEQAAKRQIKLAKRLQRVADRELAKLEKESEQSEHYAGLLAPRDISRMAMVGIRLEREVRGESPEETITQGPDLSEMSLEELRQLRTLQQKAGIK